VVEAVASALPPGRAVRAKWPNDVLVDGRKIAGILIESAAGAGGKIDWLVVGIGVNVAHHPEEAAYPTTSLTASGAGDATVDSVLGAVWRAFDHWFATWGSDGFLPIRDAWLQHAMGLGEQIEVRLPSEVLTGTFAGLDPSGALILNANGKERRITAGEIFPAGGRNTQ
jgi:BirA family biotin operon repressor/biotin-[acetyl-CoA-carboxylase] ligase